MSWLNRVRNKIPFLPKRETPENLWHKCPECDAMIFLKEYEENLWVCPRCDHHGRIGPARRFELLMDEGFALMPAPQVKEDPLRFRDFKRDTDRLKAARQQTGESDALVNAGYSLDFLVIGRHAMPHQTVGRRQPIENVDNKLRIRTQ